MSSNPGRDHAARLGCPPLALEHDRTHTGRVGDRADEAAEDWPIQVRLLAKDRSLENLERPARTNPELLDKRGSRSKRLGPLPDGRSGRARA